MAVKTKDYYEVLASVVVPQKMKSRRVIENWRGNSTPTLILVTRLRKSVSKNSRKRMTFCRTLKTGNSTTSMARTGVPLSKAEVHRHPDGKGFEHQAEPGHARVVGLARAEPVLVVLISVASEQPATSTSSRKWFGRAGGRTRRSNRGEDVEAELELSLDEAHGEFVAHCNCKWPRFVRPAMEQA